MLSVGRVQTPTLALIVKRDDEICNFKPQQYWVLSTIYRNTTFTATKGKYKSIEEGQAYLQQITGKDLTITDITTKKGKEAPFLMAAYPIMLAIDKIPCPPTPANMISVFIMFNDLICYVAELVNYSALALALAFILV